MRKIPTRTQILDYVLSYKAKNERLPESGEIADALGINVSTVQYHLRALASDGLIEHISRRERPGEDLVYAYIVEFEEKYGEYPVLENICSSLERDRVTIQRHIAEMIRNGRLENKNDFYNMPRSAYKDSVYSVRDNAKKDSGIWPGEVKRTRKKVKIGDTVLIWDERCIDPENGSRGRIVRAKVLSKYRHVVCLSHHLSCTYVQLAKWLRDRRVAIK